MSVGFPACLKLEAFGVHVYRAFKPAQSWPDYHVGVYQVGSSVGRDDPEKKRSWSDVDVVCMLQDELWARIGFETDPTYWMEWDGRWVAMCLAFCALGKEMTGLPIDFKIQPMTWANEKHKGGRRNAIFMSALHIVRDDKAAT